MAIWTKSSKTILCQLCYDKQEMQQRAFSFESNNFQWSLPHSHTCLFISCLSPWGGFNDLEQSYSFSVLLRAQCLCAYMQLRLEHESAPFLEGKKTQIKSKVVSTACWEACLLLVKESIPAQRLHRRTWRDSFHSTEIRYRDQYGHQHPKALLIPHYQD